MENKEPRKIILGFLFYCPFFGTEYLIGLYYRRKFLEGLEVNGMLVVASSEVNKKQRVYHRCGCMYDRRIKPDNRLELSEEKALRKHYKKCKYCSGMQGDVNIHKKAFVTWEHKKDMRFTFDKQTETLYIQTNIGFWKLFMKEELGMYLLYHCNKFNESMSYKESIHGDFHRQVDVKATESLEKIVDYIYAHDRAKVKIKDDYRKLPKSTKQQKKYYRAAERRDRRNAMRRLDMIFKSLEKSQSGLRQVSYC